MVSSLPGIGILSLGPSWPLRLYQLRPVFASSVAITNYQKLGVVLGSPQYCRHKIKVTADSISGEY